MTVIGLFLLFSRHALATTWTVSGDAGADFTSVQQAVDAASDGDTIDIDAGTYPESIDVGGRQLTLRGAGSAATTLGATHLSLCLEMSGGGSLTLDGLSIGGCQQLVGIDGGATLAWSDVSLLAADDLGTIEGSDLQWAGGGIQYANTRGLVLDGSAVTLQDLAFTAIDTPESALLSGANVTLLLAGVNFSRNIGTHLLNLTSSSVQMNDVQVADNEVEEAVMALSDCAMTMDNVTFDTNFSNGNNGALSLSDGSTATLSHVSFSDNSAFIKGGAVFLDSSSLRTESCTFDGNQAPDGSAIAVWDDSDWGGSDDDLSGSSPLVRSSGTDSSLVLDGCTLAATSSSGNFLVELPAGELTATACTFTDGGIEAKGTVTATACTFTGGSVVATGTITDCTLTGNGSGQALTSAGTGSLVVENTNVADFSVAFTGKGSLTGGSYSGLSHLADASGGLVVQDVFAVTSDDGIYVTTGDLTLLNSTIYAGSILLETEGDATTIQGCTLSAGSHGIRVYAGTSMLLEDTRLDAVNEGIQFLGSASPGLELNRVDITSGWSGLYTISNSTRVSANDVDITASADGLSLGAGARLGAVGLRITAGESAITCWGCSHMTVQDSDMSGLDLGINGIIDTLVLEDVNIWTGGDGVRQDGDHASLTAVEIQAGGAGFEAKGADTTLEDVLVVSGEAALVTAGLTAHDVRLYPDQECLVVNGDAQLQEISCVGAGGQRPMAIYDGDTVFIQNVEVRAASSGAPSLLQGVTATVAGWRFFDNETVTGAGALEVVDSQLDATRLHFEGNRGVLAGALTLDEGTTAAISSSIFRFNWGLDGPGAVDDQSGAAFRCCVFQEDEGEPGELLAHVRTGWIQNCTFVGANSSSGQLQFDAEYMTVVSSIVAFSQQGSGLFAPADTLSNWMYYNDVYANAGGDYGGGMADLTGSVGNLSVDPGFAAYSADGDARNDDLRLANGAACIDAGSPAWNDGDGSRSDMGAYGLDCGDFIDFDGDGQLLAEGDCDDADPSTWTGASEIPCDGIDNDCAGDGDDRDCPEDSGDPSVPDTDAAVDDSGPNPGDSGAGGKDPGRCGWPGNPAGGTEAALPLLLLVCRRRRRA